ncbi:MAG: type IV secretory system conjugative DNA transfer family protein [Saccharofermentanales bacterium]
MKSTKEKKISQYITFVIFYFVFIILTLRLAPSISAGGLVGLMNEVVNNFNFRNIFSFSFNLKYWLIGSSIYFFIVALIVLSNRNLRHTDGYGSASWGNIKNINAQFKDKIEDNNIILSNKLRMGIDGYKTQRNCNVMVVGGSGSGKTRGYVKPNLMQLNTSYIVLDPKGEILRSTGTMLKKNGYKIRVLDLYDMDKSNGYNPFKYLRKPQDVLTLANNYISNTTPKDSKSSDPFWEKAETMLLYALMFLLYEGGKPEEQNFGMLTKLLGEIDVLEDSARGHAKVSAIDDLFAWHGENYPDSLAVRYFKDFRDKAPGRTARTILLTVAVRMAPFYLKEVQSLLRNDEMEFEQLGRRKQAIFCVIPDSDTTFNFIVSMLYTQCFQELYHISDRVLRDRLPVPVHFIMDEFANVKIPENFPELLSTMRSRQIFCSIILQNISQLKEIFGDKEWESIVGNCDEFIYLGGNEQSTHEYISNLLGKETINVSTDSLTRSRQGSTSKNYQQTGRELLTVSEVRELQRTLSLIFVSGSKPVMDRKYNLEKHKRFEQLSDGGAKPYLY